jgi:hypothetical protein
MNCLLVPPLPTVQPSFITITYGLIVASLVIVAHHHGHPGIPFLIYTASASPPPSPNHSPSVSVVLVFVVVRRYHRLPPPSPMHCLIVVLL